MTSLLQSALDSVKSSQSSFTKYITANDVGKTGSHQSGFHFPKNSWKLFFDEEGVKGANKDRFIRIKWQSDFETQSRIIYYGAKTRNEYRLTRFGKGFPFLIDDNIGSLLIICRITTDFYEAFLLNTDEDIEDFLLDLNIAPDDVNGIIPRQFEVNADTQLIKCFERFISKINNEFPATADLALNSRNCYNSSYNISENQIINDPDKYLLAWINAEYELFKIIENNIYSEKIHLPFNTVEDLVVFANTVLNRRKSRAGKSLEHHLAEIFRKFDIRFTNQSISEENKKPDFIFPSQGAYSDPEFNVDKIHFLASKTTCKDRWRQILNEADRIKTKHLFTLQQGISSNQLQEMYKYGVCLVVPKSYKKSFPIEYHTRILSLEDFINKIRESQK